MRHPAAGQRNSQDIASAESSASAADTTASRPTVGTSSGCASRGEGSPIIGAEDEGVQRSRFESSIDATLRGARVTSATRSRMRPE